MRIATALLLVVGLAALPSGAASRVHAASPRDTMLISVADLAAAIDHHDSSLVLLHVGETDSYAASHIAGAHYANMDMFAAPPDTTGKALQLELPTDASLKATLESLGITPSSNIVIAESEDWYSPSTRVYLTLVHAGLGANVRLLDGGMKAWKDAGRATTADVTSPATKSTLPALKTVQVTVDTVYVQSHERTAGTVILDGRGPAAWQGLQPSSPRDVTPTRYGHIPSAQSLPLEELWDDAHSALRPAGELEALFAKQGVKPGDTIIGYCWIGQRATATLFAAATLGHPVFLYDGSMEEWARLGLPLEMPDKKDGGR